MRVILEPSTRVSVRCVVVHILAALTVFSFLPKAVTPIGKREPPRTSDGREAAMLPPRAPSGPRDEASLSINARVIGVTASVSAGASQHFGSESEGAPKLGWSSRAEAGLPLRTDLEGFRVTPVLALEHGRYGMPKSVVAPADVAVSSTLGLAGVRVEWEAVVRPAVSFDFGWGWRSARQEDAGHITTWGHTGLVAGIGAEATYDVTPRLAIGAHARQRVMRTMSSSQRESGAPRTQVPVGVYTPVFAGASPSGQGGGSEPGYDLGIATWVDAGVHVQLLF